MAKDGKTPIWKIVLVVIAVLLVLGAIGSMGGKQPATSEPTGSTAQPAPAEPEPEPEPDVPTEYKSALRKAESYSEMMHMSKQGIYDQLTSEYGEKFSPEAAQYAIDNLQADYNANALAKAQSYQDDMNMSPEAIRDQLTSEYGEKFTQEEADYAVANLG